MKRQTKWILICLGFILLLVIAFYVRQAHAFNDHACGEGDAGDQNPHCISPTPTVKPTNTPTPTNNPCKEWRYEEDCVTPTVTSKPCGWNVDHPCPTATPTPTVTPVASPSATPSPSSNTGGASGSDGGNQPPPVASCGTPFDAPVIVSFTDKGNGTVNFAWVENQTVDKYSITYGYSPDNLNMGEDNIAGSSANIDIHDLRVGSHVWLQVQAWFRGCEESSNVFDPLVK